MSKNKRKNKNNYSFDINKKRTGAASVFLSAILFGGIVVDSEAVQISSTNNATTTNSTIPSVKLHVVDGYLTYDKDNDGISDLNVPNIEVALMRDGNVISTTTTNNSGYFRFDKIPTGQYELKFINFLLPSENKADIDLSERTFVVKVEYLVANVMRTNVRVIPREVVEEKPTTEAPTTELPTTELPTTELPTTELPTTELPTTELPTTELPTTELPTTELPTTELPTTELPTTEVPTTELPTTELPTTEVPTTELPTTELPTTELPTTELPTTELPTTEVPATLDNVVNNSVNRNDVERVHTTNQNIVVNDARNSDSNQLNINTIQTADILLPLDVLIDNKTGKYTNINQSIIFNSEQSKLPIESKNTSRKPTLSNEKNKDNKEIVSIDDQKSPKFPPFKEIENKLIKAKTETPTSPGEIRGLTTFASSIGGLMLKHNEVH
ncbi:hypothetical protein LAU42_11130 [Macrococcus armenti]|uniref:SdrD B-like domain-containing protein n=1 Tax=Macrococcus armenti TaxID=2875764 RepID=UPI001CCE4EBA|nr:SdrD B-like domain-containing protein [Macrococcus armenti]UBH22263.1 hypothetical protein LAU42_11130 [Macrococcus armenti]